MLCCVVLRRAVLCLSTQINISPLPLPFHSVKVEVLTRNKMEADNEVRTLTEELSIISKDFSSLTKDNQV